MSGPAAALFSRNAVYSCGPCPGCGGGGALLLLRRRDDGALFFHCPGCGLTFTHVEEGEEPEAGRSLAAVAPRGSEPATMEEARKAGLASWAIPWTGGTHRAPVRPAKPPAKPRRPKTRALRPRESKPEKKTPIWPIVVAVFLVIRLLLKIFRD